MSTVAATNAPLKISSVSNMAELVPDITSLSRNNLPSEVPRSELGSDHFQCLTNENTLYFK